MVNALRKIIKAELPIVHFVTLSILLILFVSLLYVFFIPLIHWTLYGEGEISARVSEQPVNVFIYEWGALVIALCLCGICFYRALQHRKPDRAKSYFLAAILLLVVYIFRQEIGDFIFELFL